MLIRTASLRSCKKLLEQAHVITVGGLRMVLLVTASAIIPSWFNNADRCSGAWRYWDRAIIDLAVEFNLLSTGWVLLISRLDKHCF